MAITRKQYVDLEGLTEFKKLLVGKYADGTFIVMKATNATNAETATNYKTADGGSASIETALFEIENAILLSLKRLPKSHPISSSVNP